MSAAMWKWRTLLRELDQLSEARMRLSDKGWLIRTDATPEVATIFRQARIALPLRATDHPANATASEGAPTSRPSKA